jgi:hypothetical protein
MHGPAWRSIWNAKPLLEEGLIWKVGDGTKINIWSDKWIRSTLTHKFQVPNQILDSNAKVSQLINIETNWWNIPVIESLFPPDVVEQICSMAISPCTTQDLLIWSGT